MGGISHEYASYYNKYKEEYGEKVCVFMKVGSFYNFYEMQPNPTEYTSLLNVQIMKKKDTEINDPDKGGFPTLALNKYLPILIDNGYTVVIVDGGDAVKTGGGKRSNRYVSGIYSPSIQPPDQGLDQASDDCNLTSIVIESTTNAPKGACVSYSIINLNMQTNTFDVYENTTSAKSVESVYDEVYRFLTSYQIRELLVHVVGDKLLFEKDYFCKYFDMSPATVLWTSSCPKYTEYSNVQFQNLYLQKVYKHIDFGMLDPIDYFDMSHCQVSVTNMLYVLDFISRHDVKYIQHIASPKLIDECNHLVLEMNTLHQLHLLPGKGGGNSLFDIINKTQTAVGRRGLKSLLCKPFRKASDIQKRYEISEMLYESNIEPSVSKVLKCIGDFERLHRKMSLQVLHPHEFVRLHTSYEHILELNELVYQCGDCQLGSTLQDQLVEFMDDYTSTFDLSEMKTCSLSEGVTLATGNYFKQGVEELDTIQVKVTALENTIDDIRIGLEGKLKGSKRGEGDNWIKVNCSEEGYHFTCSNIRLELLKKALSKDEWGQYQVKQNSNSSKVTSTELTQISNQLMNCKELFMKRIKRAYLEKLRGYSDKYSTLFQGLKVFVELIDIIMSNIKCRKLYRYCKADIIDEPLNESSFEAKDLRHPIIERIKVDTQYVSNDIVLNKDKRGMILYAMNSCGKSSLLRSVGLCVVMAQCGLYVPCTELKLSPFESVVSQVEMYDNLWKGQSSFITEIVGLRKILKVADEKCLVLSDELTKGTEVVSATSLFAASTVALEKKHSKFIFTTHLQDVSKLDLIKECKSILVCHLSVDIRGEDEIIFERKLKEGPCSELYGLEVAKALGLDKELIECAFEIRDTLVNRKHDIVKPKRSKYNKRKIIDACEICDYSPNKKTDIPLDTHHIEFQCQADSDHFIGSFHKNSSFNLVVLCKTCHQDVHAGLITINGYKQTTCGTKLEYERHLKSK
jgi:DNA mismatch repair protein MutS